MGVHAQGPVQSGLARWVLDLAPTRRGSLLAGSGTVVARTTAGVYALEGCRACWTGPPMLGPSVRTRKAV